MMFVLSKGVFDEYMKIERMNEQLNECGIQSIEGESKTIQKLKIDIL